MTEWWRRVVAHPGRLKLVLSYGGVGLALAAVVVDRTWFTWVAIAVLSTAVLLRLVLQRRGGSAPPPPSDER